MKKDAVLSKCGHYRYSLSRIWDQTKPLIGFIGLNPSTADHIKDDKTISRCISFSKAWGFGGFYMMNLFAYRATKPSVMMQSANPIGFENNNYLLELKSKVDKVAICWGDKGQHNGRSKEVLSLLNQGDLYCITINKSGQPKHPLYIKGDAQLIPYETS
jgi:hypothetical protein